MIQKPCLNFVFSTSSTSQLKITLELNFKKRGGMPLLGIPPGCDSHDNID